jgi:hypothetical protein
MYDRCINMASKPALKEQLSIEKETIQKRKERKAESVGHQPGQWENGDRKR